MFSFICLFFVLQVSSLVLCLVTAKREFCTIKIDVILKDVFRKMLLIIVKFVLGLQ